MRTRLRLAVRLAGAAALLLAAGSAGPRSAYGSSTADEAGDFAASGRSVAVEASYDRPGTTIWAPTVSFGAAYTESSVTNDPAVLGLGASLYPGGLILICTEGVSGRCPVGYPMWARSTHVDETIDAPAGRSFTSPDGSVVLEAQTSHAETSSQPKALGTASSGRVVLGGAATVDSARSASQSLRQDGTILSRAWSTLQGISLLGGAMKIESLSSESSASIGDAPKAASTVEVQGATFNGQQIAFDDHGVRVVDPSVPPERAEEVSKAMNEQLLKNFGVKITLVQAPTVQKPDLAAAETSGLRIASATSEGGQGAPWCDPARGLPPITNCKQVDDVAVSLGASSAAVSRSLGAPDRGGLIDVGAGVAAPGGDQPGGDFAAAAPGGDTPAPGGDTSAPGGDTPAAGALEGYASAAAQTYPAAGESAAGGDGSASSSAMPAEGAGDGVSRRPLTTDSAAPIARTIKRQSVRPAQVALLGLSWLLAAACLAVLVARSRLARARAAELGL